jgi:pantoate--beta-alanine ligase
MVADLCLGVEVVGAETVREDDGLAMSSRNRYLSAEDRQSALVLNRALRAGQAAGAHGAAAVLEAARTELASATDVAVDYLALTAPDLGATPASGEARLLVAAKVGHTRLIDNMPITIGASTGPAGGDSPTPKGDS